MIMMDMFWTLYSHTGGYSEDMIPTVNSYHCLKASMICLKIKLVSEKLIR